MTEEILTCLKFQFRPCHAQVKGTGFNLYTANLSLFSRQRYFLKTAFQGVVIPQGKSLLEHQPQFFTLVDLKPQVRQLPFIRHFHYSGAMKLSRSFFRYVQSWGVNWGPNACFTQAKVPL